MSSMLKLRVVGGEKNGFEMSFDCSKPVLVGRSRSADLHLPEPDVSGKHFEFVKVDTGCLVRVLSRNGLVVDGRTLQCGDTMRVQDHSLIEAGMRAKVRFDGLVDGAVGASYPGSSETADAASSTDAFQSISVPGAEDMMAGSRNGDVGESQPRATDVGSVRPQDDLDAETASDHAPDPPASAHSEDVQLGEVVDDAPQNTNSVSVSNGAEFNVEETNADHDDSLTAAGEDGETQEMRTRIGSLEEIRSRKQQLDRTNFHRRMSVAGLIGLFVAALAVAWYFFGWQSTRIDIDGPYLADGKSFDHVEMDILDENGAPEFYIDYPRYDAMTVTISPDSNSVEVATWFGTRSDVPFHLEFTRWTDRSDLMRSLEASFERWMLDETTKGSAFDTRGGNRPKGEFFEDEFPTFLEKGTLRGMRFVRAECTRSRDGELWRGNCIYFRKGDRIHLLRLEVPDLYWNIAKIRVTDELHLGIYSVFSRDHWDSPGMAGIVDAKLSDDELILRIKHEFSAERVAVWPDLAMYIDTLLVRSWGDKPRIQKEAMSFYQLMQEQMDKFYRERELALMVARTNRDDKRMNSILQDCKAAFGALPRDRRLTLVNNPEVWSWR